MRRFISLMPLVALMAVAACETIKGAGHDIENAGHTLFPPGNGAPQNYGNQQSYNMDPGMSAGGGPVIEVQPYDGSF